MEEFREAAVVEGGNIKSVGSQGWSFCGGGWEGGVSLGETYLWHVEVEL